ncbi:transposase [Pseudomonas sp. HAR-UPW-AIA-41]|uniref:TniB family NTP-binding protein n=1 Tax=Pseudomonas sp. HAR-UPW-AIA-41 TaxID=1985301 RepID=UPI000BB2F620|nr:TniB family NTP-binding protein [Pseudomonas sp. HAR-UPW-AIA-41]PAV47287.1 transposase [Pseudomonas sp. HAR-UPW-AIA-41]
MTNLAKKVVRSEGIFHAHMLRAYERGLAVIAQAQVPADKREPQIFPLLGPAGVGKSETIAAWCADYPQQQDAQGKIVKPVIHVICPVEPNQRSIALSIIRALQCRVLSRSSTSDVVDQAMGQLKVAEVNTIIFDEVQHLAENLRAEKMKIAVNFLQYILETSKASLILVGLPTAQRFINFESAFQRRCLATELLYPYAWASTSHRQDFADGVAMIAEAYREHGWKTVLDDPDSLKPLYAACMGRFGVLIDFLSHAETDNSRKLIDMKCLAKAYAHGINHQPFSGNPFSPSTQISEQELNAEYVRVLQQAHLPIPKL